MRGIYISRDRGASVTEKMIDQLYRDGPIGVHLHLQGAGTATKEKEETHAERIHKEWRNAKEKLEGTRQDPSKISETNGQEPGEVSFINLTDTGTEDDTVTKAEPNGDDVNSS